MPTAQQKTCVVCGADCADRPRVKDPKGRYYCKPCYEQLSEQKRQSAPTPPAPGDMPLQADAIDADDERSALFSEIADTAPSTGKTCPQCGAELDQQAVLCVRCGYNFQSGEALQMQVQKAKSARSGGAVWPIVIGVICLVIGIGGLVMHISSVFYATENAGGATGGVIVPAIISLWLSFAGYRITRRQSSGVKLARQWAIAKIVLATLGIGLLITLVMAFDASDRIEQMLWPNTAITAGQEVLIVTFILLWLWALLWPVFLLIWFNRASIQEQIADWD